MKMKNKPEKKAEKKAVRRVRRNIIAHIARTWEEAEEWDLEFWFNQTPRIRISALESLRNDYKLIKNARH